MKRKTKDAVLTAISLIALVILWLVASYNSPRFFPSPMKVCERLLQLFQSPIGKTSIFGHILVSLRRVMVGFVVASILGIITGLAMGWNKKARAIINPIFTALRPIPPIAWIPLVILWFGIGEFSKYLLIFIGAYFVVVLNTAAGVAMVEPMYISVGRVYKANTWLMLRHIVFPAAMPAIIAGLKIALSTSWMVVVAAEMIASKSGLGFLITRGSESLDVALVMISMILIGVVGALLSAVFSWLERRICPWK